MKPKLSALKMHEKLYIQAFYQDPLSALSPNQNDLRFSKFSDESF